MKKTLNAVVAAGGLALLALATAPAGAQTVTLTRVGEIPGPAEHIRVQGDHAYVSYHSSFTVWDVSDPAAPARMGSTELPQEIWGFRVRGDRAYVGANFFGVAIVDISDPAAPMVLGNHETLGQTKIGAVYENRVVLIDHMEGMVLVDATDETAPTGAGSFFLDGYARDVVTSGPMAYATDSPTGLYVFDLSAPGPPEPVGILHAPAAPRAIEVQREVGEPSGLLAGAGGGHLQIYDASDPDAPGAGRHLRDAGARVAGGLLGLPRLRGRHRGRRRHRGHLGPGGPGARRDPPDRRAGARRRRNRHARLRGRRGGRAPGGRDRRPHLQPFVVSGAPHSRAPDRAGRRAYRAASPGTSRGPGRPGRRAGRLPPGVSSVERRMPSGGSVTARPRPIVVQARLPPRKRDHEGTAGSVAARLRGPGRTRAADSQVTTAMDPLLTPEERELVHEQRALFDASRALLADLDLVPGDVEALEAMRRRLDELFLIMVVGEFNAGKSTFLNAVLGIDALETGELPTTRSVHLLRHGAIESVREVEPRLLVHELPVEVLQELNIVDTPGTNSMQREEQLLTEGFVPRADIVFFVTSLLRPYSGERARLPQAHPELGQARRVHRQPGRPGVRPRPRGAG